MMFSEQSAVDGSVSITFTRADLDALSPVDFRLLRDFMGMIAEALGE
jgi:hypothetical protein